MMHAIGSRLLSLLLVHLQITRGTLLVRKCCPDEEHYLKLHESDGLWCNNGHDYKHVGSKGLKKFTSDVVIDEQPKFPSWMDRNITVLSPKTLTPVPGFLSDQDSGTYLEYGVEVLCGRWPKMYIPSTSREYSLLHNGSLMFRTLAGKNVSYPPSSYCADSALLPSGESLFLYVLCPCLHNPCIPSCCDRDETVDYVRGFLLCKNTMTGTWNAIPVMRHHFEVVPIQFSYDRKEEILEHKNNILWGMNGTYTLSLHDNITLPHSVENVCANIIPSKHSENYKYQLVKYEILAQAGIQFYYSVKYCSVAVHLLTLLVFILAGEAMKNKSKIIVSHITCSLIAELCSGLSRKFSINLIIKEYILENYVLYFYMATPLWINVLCFDLAASFRSFWVSNSRVCRKRDRRFLYYNMYVWSFTTVARILIDNIADNAHTDSYIRRFYIPLTLGVINSSLLSYTISQLIKRQRQSGALDNENSARHNAASCFHKHRRLLVHINLLLLMGPPSAIAGIAFYVYGPNISIVFLNDAMNLLKAVCLFSFVLLKPRIWIVILNKMKTFSNHLTRRGVQVSRDQRTASTEL